jgi:hypothetical protein
MVSILVLVQPVSLPVAFITIFSGNHSVSEDDSAVAFITTVLVTENGHMIISRCFFRDKIFLCVAVVTFSYIGIVFTFFKMTDKTTAFRDGNVFSLDDLRMAACATELLSSLQVRKMNFVVEYACFIFYLSFQKPLVVTSFS